MKYFSQRETLIGIPLLKQKEEILDCGGCESCFEVRDEEAITVT